MLDQRSKIFFASLLFLFSVVALLSYWRVMVAKAYDIYIDVPCASADTSCFVGDCAEREGEVCYDRYKIVRHKAYDVPRLCETMDVTHCPSLSMCAFGHDCEVIECTEETAERFKAPCAVKVGGETREAE